jgi:hypothetical protein
VDEVDVSAMQDLACGGEAIELTEATDRQADADDQRPFPKGSSRGAPRLQAVTTVCLTPRRSSPAVSRAA